MGARLAVSRTPALHDSDRRPVPLEFSLVAILASDPRDLRGRGVAVQARVCDSTCSGACAPCVDERYRVHFPRTWFVRFPAHLDSSWIGLSLDLFGVPVTPLQFSTLDVRGDHFLRAARDISLRPDKLRSSQVQFFSR